MDLLLVLCRPPAPSLIAATLVAYTPFTFAVHQVRNSEHKKQWQMFINRLLSFLEVRLNPRDCRHACHLRCRHLYYHPGMTVMQLCKHL